MLCHKVVFHGFGVIEISFLLYLHNLLIGSIRPVRPHITLPFKSDNITKIILSKLREAVTKSYHEAKLSTFYISRYNEKSTWHLTDRKKEQHPA